jgi:hypothetical protein
MNDPRGFFIHVALLALLTVLGSIVYHSLRRDDVRECIVVGVRKAGYYLLLAFMFGVGAQLLALWL